MLELINYEVRLFCSYKLKKGIKASVSWTEKKSPLFFFFQIRIGFNRHFISLKRFYYFQYNIVNMVNSIVRHMTFNRHFISLKRFYYFQYDIVNIVNSTVRCMNKWKYSFCSGQWNIYNTDVEKLITVF